MTKYKLEENKIVKVVENSKIVNIKGISMESDVFYEFMKYFKKDKREFSNVVNIIWETFRFGKLTDLIKYQSMKVIKSFISKMNSNDKNELHFKLKKTISNPFLEMSPELYERIAEVSSYGIFNELNMNPLDYKDFLNSTNKKEAENIVIKRGKEKLTDIISRRNKNDKVWIERRKNGEGWRKYD